ncbi:hypothetical protein HFX_6348 (plasmid) [Haloferax mediterranei ATCC 33500]|uniref:Uncharacterized protein n=1 Tax=Haloferax mediterranei (strain ATCC 33500 / DSM 1411 / JCM 8866 / NBRC 14739 / NCIMB 2177 / R-4) TaxID=523841 RepID=I3RB59_HALMT|nr:hypothetical protein HFX_6348 [Haloferax mediterranei ATCC 33500]
MLDEGHGLIHRPLEPRRFGEKEVATRWRVQFDIDPTSVAAGVGVLRDSAPTAQALFC